MKVTGNDNGFEAEASERVPTSDGGASAAGEGSVGQGAAAPPEGQAADAPAVNPETGEETIAVPADGGQPENPPKLPTTVSH
mgnify:FL=1